MTDPPPPAREADEAPAARAGSGSDDAQSVTIADHDAGGSAPEGPAEPRGTTVGRYVLVDRIGHGGMGEVYRAFDPKLSRLVALKYVRFDKKRQAEAQSRLFQEAQAIAQVSHPNVVAVFDVGGAPSDDVQGEDRVFIAMELVEGPTLRAWLRRAKGEPARTSTQILEVFLRAGRGLAAAHEQGIVHRDFKPENVLLSARGVPKVVDFGLAKPSSERVLDPEIAAALGTERSEIAAGASGTRHAGSNASVDGSHAVTGEGLRDGLTRAGARLGTPAYMSPEQWSGEVTTAKCDQFSFAVALWEALYGQLPFHGPSIDAYAYRVLEGELRDPPRDQNVPRHLCLTLTRALCVDPEDRFPTMGALLDELALDPRRRTRTLVGLGLTTAVAVGLATGGYTLARRSQDDQLRACLDSVERQTTHWTGQDREQVRARLVATGRPFAPELADRAVDGLDAAMERWRTLAQTSCQDLGVPELPDEAQLEAARRICLERALAAHRDLISSLDDLPPASLEFVPGAVARVERSVDACTHVAKLRDLWQRQRQIEAHPEIARGIELVATDVALGRATIARERLEALPRPPATGAWPPALYADYMFAAVDLELLDGDPDHAVRRIDDALARLVGESLPDGDRLSLQAKLAEARYAAGDYEGMRPAYRRHYQMSVAQLGNDDVETALAYAMQGHHPYATGNYARALEFYQEGLDRARRLDPTHVHLETLRDWAAEAQLAGGEPAGARATLEPVFERRTKRLGPTHPETLSTALILGRALLAEGEVEAAKVMFDDLLAAHRRDPTWKGTRDEVALLGNLGAALLLADLPQAAEPRLREAIALLDEAGVDADDRLRVALDANLGTTYLDTDRPVLALELLRSAAARSESLGEAHTRNGFTLRRQLAVALARTGELRAARSALERAVEDARARDMTDVEAETWVALARVTHEQGDQAATSRASAEARALLASETTPGALGARLERQLAALGQPTPARDG